jgi:DNA-binding NtrC family response regulator
VLEMTRYKKPKEELDIQTEQAELNNEHIVKAKEIANTIDTRIEQSSNDDTTYAPVDYENAFIPYRIGNYKDIMGLKHELYNHVMSCDQPVLLIGDKGSGKTMTVHHY